MAGEGVAISYVRCLTNFWCFGLSVWLKKKCGFGVKGLAEEFRVWGLGLVT